MIYFTVSDRDIYADKNAQISFTPQKRAVKFGDGYELSIPRFPTIKSFSASFSNRTPEEVNFIDNYLAFVGGSNIPNFYVMGELVKVSCINYSKSYQNGQIFSIQAQFREEL